jgi:K+-transporting ATPase ATPase A chain
MTGLKAAEFLIYAGLLTAITPLLGGYMKRVFAGERSFLDPVLRSYCCTRSSACRSFFL